MRCLYCGKILLFRSRTKGSQFCSQEHRETYNSLALERLLECEQEPPPARLAAKTEVEPPREWVPAAVADFRMEVVPPAEWSFGPLATVEMRFGFRASLPRVGRPMQPRASTASAPLAVLTVVPRREALGGPKEGAEPLTRSQVRLPRRQAAPGIRRGPAAADFQAVCPRAGTPRTAPWVAVAMRPWPPSRCTATESRRPQASSQALRAAPPVSVGIHAHCESLRQARSGAEKEKFRGAFLNPVRPPAPQRPAARLAPPCRIETACRQAAAERTLRAEPVVGRAVVKLHCERRVPSAGAAWELAPLQAVVVEFRAGPVHRGSAVFETWKPRQALPCELREPMGLPEVRQSEAVSEFSEESPIKAHRIARWIPAWIRASRPVPAAILTLPLIAAGLFFWLRPGPTPAETSEPRLGLNARFEAALRSRAAIEINEDFRSGLSGWDGGGGAISGWTYDGAGFVRPGKLALLTASRPLSNYRFEFVGLIGKGGLAWAFRASDLQNYYAMKIVISKPGPLPQGAVVRYTVVNGEETGRAEFPLPLSVRNDTVYHVETSVYQDHFITSIDGQVVDTFSDPAHPSGGVGLFGIEGDDTRILRVRVADRDDILGQICAYFSGNSADSPIGLPPLPAPPGTGRSEASASPAQSGQR